MSSKPYPRWFYKLPAKYHETAAPSNPYPKWITWIGLFLVILVGLNSFYEWFTIHILADKAMITDYKSVYPSPESYATSALHTALSCLPIALFFAFAIKTDRNSHRMLAIGILITALSICLFFN